MVVQITGDVRNGCVTSPPRRVAAGCGAADRTAVDLFKGSVSVLTGRITLSSARSAWQLVAGTISTDALAAGDVLEIEVDAVSGGGTMGKGVFAYVDLEEDYD